MTVSRRILAVPLLSSLCFYTNYGSYVPVIDIEPWTAPESSSSSSYASINRQAVVDAVDQACRQVGFFAILGHEVNTTTLSRAWNAAQNFFDQPTDVKGRYKTTNESDYPYGYEQTERLQVGKTKTRTENVPVDLKETFSIGPYNPESGMPARRFPEFQEFQSALEDYYVEMEAVANTLLRIFAAALELPLDWFLSHMTHHISALRILNYFEVDNVGGERAIRASAHTDYGALTILKSGGPGLQVKKDVGDEEEWIDVPDLEDAFIINIGDMMQRWTNDKWVSTLHRVIIPPSSDGFVERRQSIAYFCNVNGETVVTPLPTCVDQNTAPSKYPPITAKDHLMAKHLASMGIHSNHDEL